MRCATITASAGCGACTVQIAGRPTLGVKGLGEMALAGAGAAVVNAVWHAPGQRVTELPVNIDKLIAGR